MTFDSISSLARPARILSLALLLGVTSASHGQTPPEGIHQLDEMLPGFKPKQVYDVSGIDQVNLFSGDPHLAVPLGPSYPLAYGMSFQLTAHYSAKIWNVSSGLCDYDPYHLCETEIRTNRAHVVGHPTLGVGWTLEVGFIAPGTTANAVKWKTPDGGVHECSDGGGTSTGRCGDLNVRIRPLASGGYRVSLPDGSSQIYAHRYQSPVSVNAADFNDQERFEPTITNERFGLTEMRDRLDRPVLVVQYRGDYANLAEGWKVDRILLRRGEPEGTIGSWPAIVYHWAQGGSGAWPVLSSIEFPPSDATGGVPQQATFTIASRAMHRTDLSDNSNPTKCGFPLYPEEPVLPFLDAITVSGLRPYAFTYYASAANTELFKNGTLRTVTLPTGGMIEYTYKATSGRAIRYPECTACASPEALPATLFPEQEAPEAVDFDPCTDLAKRALFLDRSPAVFERIESDPVSASASVTRYHRAAYASPEYESDTYSSPSRGIRRIIVDRPSGNAGDGRTYEAHYLSVPLSGGSPVELETRTWHEPSGTSPAPNRSTVTCYEGTPSAPEFRCGVLEPDVVQPERWITVDSSRFDPDRLTKSVVWYGANPLGGGECSLDTTLACHQTAYSGPWNEVARRYPIATESIDRSTGNPSLGLVPPDWVSRVTTTTLNPEATSTTWLPNLIDDQTVTETYTTGCMGANAFRAPCTKLTTYTFNRTNGFLERVQTVNPSNSSEYLRTTWTPDTEGNPAIEVRSGTGIVSSTSFRTDRLFQHGLVRKSSRVGVPGAWASFDVDRDPVTGLITASRDPNGPETRFSYDSLGRLTSVSPPSAVPTTYAYLEYQPGSRPPFVLSKQTGARPDSTDDGVPAVGSGSVEAYQYDGFGRIRRQIRRLPNRLAWNPTTGPWSYFAFQESRYDAAGNLAFLSEWVPCESSPSDETDLTACFESTAPAGTTWSNFDLQGRARSLQLADGSVTTKYFADWEFGIPDSDTAEITVIQDIPGRNLVSGSRKDIFGRLLAVAEPAESTQITGRAAWEDFEFPFVSRYDHNTFGQMTAARVLESLGHSQKRTFTYNSLGLLTQEKTPERSDDGNVDGTGYTTYGSYDALGNVLQKSLDGLPYTYAYDPLGRLQTARSNGTLYLQNTWDAPSSSGATNYGRLTTRLGTNPSLSQNITESFEYDPESGRMSGKSTTFGSGLLSTVTERWHYNDLGLLATYNHPRSTGLFSVATTFVSGLPVTVSANGLPVVLAAQYHPSGALASYTTGNDPGGAVTTSIEIDRSTWMPRPSSIWTAGASTGFSSGSYEYDAKGNILAIGDDWFEYDTRSRLNMASLEGRGGYQYFYDGLGNMIEAPFFSFDINPLTNHILTASNRLEPKAPQTAYSYVRGNLRSRDAELFDWDPFDRMTRYSSGSSFHSYAYTGTNERILTVPNGNLPWAQYTLRDAENRVATELAGNGSGVSWMRDNVYLGSLLVGSYHSCASGSSPAWEYLSSDHLGTPRLATDASGETLWWKKYTPYGEELNPSNDSTAQPLEFALMEKDLRLTDTDITRYYDHARTHSSTLGRFLSPDLLAGSPEDPQSLNRYVYAGNNPLRFVDPDGRIKRDANGRPVFTPVRVVSGTHPSGERTVAQEGRLYADDGTPITAYNEPSNKLMRSDCHGLTFADGDFWINNDQVPALLNGDGYVKTDSPSVGDVGVYTDASGNPVHSVTVSKVSPDGTVQSVAGLGGTESAASAKPPAPGPGGAWNDPNARIEYYKKSKVTETEEDRAKRVRKAETYVK